MQSELILLGNKSPEHISEKVGDIKNVWLGRTTWT
jgi:hypothetical protein